MWQYKVENTKYILKLRSNDYSYVFINIGCFYYFCIIDFLYIILDYNNKLKKKNLWYHKTKLFHLKNNESNQIS